jgi:hypothetical protein
MPRFKGKMHQNRFLIINWLICSSLCEVTNRLGGMIGAMTDGMTDETTGGMTDAMTGVTTGVMTDGMTDAMTGGMTDATTDAMTDATTDEMTGAMIDAMADGMIDAMTDLILMMKCLLGVGSFHRLQRWHLRDLCRLHRLVPVVLEEYGVV